MLLQYYKFATVLVHVSLSAFAKLANVCAYHVALPSFTLPRVCSTYWPLFLLFFYILCPIPYCISRRVVDDTDSTSNACKELAIFLTTGIVISAFGLPIVFARADVVSGGHKEGQVSQQEAVHRNEHVTCCGGLPPGFDGPLARDQRK